MNQLPGLNLPKFVGWLCPIKNGKQGLWIELVAGDDYGQVSGLLTKASNDHPLPAGVKHVKTVVLPQGRAPWERGPRMGRV